MQNWTKCILKDEYLKHGLVRFPDMIKIELCKLGHKTTKDNIPKPLKSIMDKRGGKINMATTPKTKTHLMYKLTPQHHILLHLLQVCPLLTCNYPYILAFPLRF